MSIEIRRAQRRRARLRMALVGPTGSGKTYSALQLAFGIGQKVGVIDTENNSADLYAHLGNYDVIELGKPFTVPRYREAIQAFEAAKYDVIIIDSLSHAWAGEGGLLDKQGQLENSGKFRNSFASWREITPEQNKLIAELLQSPTHIIATMRTKTEYVIDKDDRGKSVPRKIGLSPVQRDGVEYEFTLVMDINAEHYASASKDRTGLFDGWSDRISAATGTKLLGWLEDGDAEVVVKDSAADGASSEPGQQTRTSSRGVESPAASSAKPKATTAQLRSFRESVAKKFNLDDDAAAIKASSYMAKLEPPVTQSKHLTVVDLQKMMTAMLEETVEEPDLALTAEELQEERERQASFDVAQAAKGDNSPG